MVWLASLKEHVADLKKTQRPATRMSKAVADFHLSKD